MPEASFPVRPVGKRRRVVIDVPESPDVDPDVPPPASQRRLHHHVASTPIRKKSKAPKVKRALPSAPRTQREPLFDGEAEHSGDEGKRGLLRGGRGERVRPTVHPQLTAHTGIAVV